MTETDLFESKSSYTQKTILEFYESKIEEIPIKDIIVNERIRSSLEPRHIENLANSIREIGLLNPITITKNKTLIAGNHRLEACKTLGWSNIPCVISKIKDPLKIELQEIDENLVRYDLHYLDRAIHLKRRKEIYEELYPETKQGQSQALGMNKKLGNVSALSAVTSKKSFVEDTSEKIGVSERTISEDIQIATDIDPEIQPKIKEYNIPKKEAIKLARLKNKEKEKEIIEEKEQSKNDPKKIKKIKEKEKEIFKDQHEVIKRIEDGKSKNVKEAITQIKKERKLEEARKNKTTHQKKNFRPIISQKDALEFLGSIENNSQDLLLTDPPYMKDLDIDIELFVNQWIPRALEKVKDTGRIYIFTGHYPKEIQCYINVLSNQGRFTLGNILIWTYKNTLGPSTNNKYKNNYQCIFYLFGKDAPPLNTDSLLEKFSVKEYNAPDGRQYNRFFKWQKPNDLTELLIRHSTQEGDLIIDPFAGSGTFILKATEMKRFAKGSEIDPKVIEIAKKRGCIIK